MSLLKYAQKATGQDEATVMKKYASDELYKKAVDLATTEAVIRELKKYEKKEMTKEAAGIPKIPSLLAMLKNLPVGIADDVVRGAVGARDAAVRNANAVKNAIVHNADEFGRGMKFGRAPLSERDAAYRAMEQPLREAIHSLDTKGMESALRSTGRTTRGTQSTLSSAQELLDVLAGYNRQGPLSKANLAGRITSGLGLGGAGLGAGAYLTKDSTFDDIFSGLGAIPSDAGHMNPAAIAGLGGALAGGIGGAAYNGAVGEDQLLRRVIQGALAGGGAGVAGGALYGDPLT